MPINAFDNPALDVFKIIDSIEKAKNSKDFVAKVVHHAINRKGMATMKEVESYVWVVAVLVDCMIVACDSWKIGELVILG
jgi:hypothetical protein